MLIQPMNPISFGYKSIVKTLYKQGQLTSVTKDIYGQKLTPNNVTIEHIIPKSKKGASSLKNYALATAKANQQRSSDPLLKHTTIENIKAYLEQFKGIKKPQFNGDEYIKGVTNTLRRINIDV